LLSGDWFADCGKRFAGAGAIDVTGKTLIAAAA